MKFYEIVAWYQKKIGTYDKQQWEKTVEQKILHGFSSVTLKNAKLKTELIDVDLVRGSTFHKAKPKQTLLTVIRFAILRYFFLPVYTQWWVHQTSPNAFGLLLFLYITQMVNWAIYAFNINHLNVAASITNGGGSSSSRTAVTTIYNNATISSSFSKNIRSTSVEEQSVSIAELLIPMALSLLLSLIHSQIVATNCAGLGLKSSHRRFSNTSSKEHRLPTRLRRRKKFVRIRGQDTNENVVNETAQRKLNSYDIRLNSGVEILEGPISDMPSKNKAETEKTVNGLQAYPFKSFVTASQTLTNHQVSKRVNKRHSTDSIATTPKLQCDLKPIDGASNLATSFSTDCFTHNLNKKRNVNWHSPVHNYAVEIHEKQQQQQTSPVSTTSSEEASSMHDDNAVSSTSSSSSSNKSSHHPMCVVHLEDAGVQEFYDSLINETITSKSTSSSTTTTTPKPKEATSITSACAAPAPSLPTVQQPAALNEKRIVGEDDGFESLNGKSSSGEETNAQPLQAAQAIRNQDLQSASGKQQLQLRPTKRSGIMKIEHSAGISKSVGATSYCYRSTNSDIGYNSAARQPRSTKPESTDETDEETCDDAQTVSSPGSIINSPYNECTTSATEWLGVTTNSEECSYSSEFDNSDDYKKHSTAVSDDYDGYDLDFTPTTILNPHGTSADRISCTIWDQHEAKKAQMSVLEISSSIIERVESMPETNDYIYIGICFSVTLSLVPSFYRLCEITIDSDNRNEISYFDLPMLLWQKASFSFMTIFQFAFGQTPWERAVLIIGFIQRLCLTLMLFMIFSVAERTFKQRFLYGKLFSHLTSSRRAKKSNLPHFRLNKVRNIKTWLSVRSYLKKRGPQRSVDIIVSAAFIVTLFLVAFLSVEWLKDSSHLHSHLNLEALMWSTAIGIFVLRFMTLGNKIHHKYRSVSVLITEQINLYLQIEQKPKKKEELMVSNSVLKLAADLLKELESPFKISGLSANPYLFTTIKVVILSALSGMLSEMLGFKLKLHKIKIK